MSTEKMATALYLAGLQALTNAKAERARNPKARKAKSPKAKGPTRLNVTYDAISVKPTTVEKIAEKADAEFVRLGGKSNKKQTVHLINCVAGLLEHAGLIKITDDGKISRVA